MTPTDTSRSWNTAAATGLLRLVVGAVLLRWRHPLARRLGGASDGDRVLPLLFGYFGVRDMTVGVVTLAATRPGGDVPRAVRLQGLADATDAALVAAVAASGRLSRPRAIGAGAVAVVSALGEFATAARLRRP
ncbi:MAG: hypothetical protein QOG34_1273 [Frankiaceae bacterium]|nr:hypothetical protein [Frankiaceae bacterium]